MVVANRAASIETFFQAVRSYSSLAILSDYDGTLAPFVVERDLARPYPGVPELLLKLIDNGVRVAIVTGRSATDMHKLLGINSIEVWGSHGAERILSSGEYLRLRSNNRTEFEVLVDALERERLSPAIELKPFGVAVHWRGLPAQAAAENRFAAIRAYQSVVSPVFQVLDFDGGMEFRLRGTTKADAVRQVKSESPNLPMVYLGDDLTDEDAFAALQETDLSILVRPEYRPTSAQMWIKPPDQLISFLQLVAGATGGSR